MNTKICPACKNPIPANAPGGLCPACVLRDAEEPPPAGRAAPPLAEVAAAFPHFEVVEMIGRGGMGAVFKVRQPKLNRFAALKLLPQSLAADPAFAGRFEREAQLLAKLNHPNIVSVYDFGQTGGFFHLLMEYVEGVNLRQAMRASRFTPAQALGVVPKICEALQYAHNEGVLHRDIKPENILLDAKGRVKLADFGIAKLIGERTERSRGTEGTGNKESFPSPSSFESLTSGGTALGTPQYMAPEQRDTPADVDHRADIYSLGVVFYELLTGELPVGKFAPPSERSTADPRVDDIVRQAMEKERDRRQGSAEEMRTQVQTVIERSARPPAATPVPVPGKTFRSRIRRAVLAGGALLLLAGIVLFGLDGLLPPVYLSKVAMEVKDDVDRPNRAFNAAGRSGTNPLFLRTQFGILQKTEVLYQVIDNLKLVESWSTTDRKLTLQSTYAKLLNMLALREEKDTGLIEVGVYSTDPVEAANIANTIAVVYQQKRFSDLQKNMDKGLEGLKDEVEKQRKRADEDAVEMARISGRFGVVDPNPTDYGTSLTLSKDKEGDTTPQESKDRIGEYIEAKTRFVQAKRIYEAAQTKYATELLERGIDFDPAKIWEKAEPAISPTRFSLYRLRHAFDR